MLTKRTITTKTFPIRIEGILNVAEDLLGNNGEKFLEMMDRLELEGRLEYTPRAKETPSIEVPVEEEEEKCENEASLLFDIIGSCTFFCFLICRYWC